VAQAIEDVFAMILLLRVRGAEANAPLLRVEIPKADWVGQAEMEVSIAPDDVLLLRENA